jgi:hypothetical protein
VRGVRKFEIDVREHVEKLGIEVDKVCIRVHKRWTSARANPRLRSNYC